MRLRLYISIFLALALLTNTLNFNQSFATFAKNEIKTMNTSAIKFISKQEGVKEYLLPNGLKILLKENHNIPLITFSIWYKAGSRNETKGIRGIAHFLEHMMFKGTKNYKKGEISEVIQNKGGVFNAFTANDVTAYYEVISPKYIEDVIKIESDRIKSSLIDEDELNLERTVVLSELEGDLNSPVSTLDKKLRETAYDTNPYKYPVIGYEEDIKNINPNIMRKFYKQFYNPNNAAVVLTGDFNEQKSLELISKYFGNIKNDNFEISSTDKEPEQTREKRIKIKQPGTFKILEIAYHICNAKDKDIYPLNIIEEILIKGKNSRLSNALLDTGLATQVDGGAEANVDPGLFYILVSLTPKASHKKVESIIRKEIEKLITSTLNSDEVNAAKNRIKANYLFNLDGTYNQAFNLGYFDSISSWKESIDWTKNILRVNNEDISNTLKKYFKDQNKTVGYFIPILRKGDKYESKPISISKSHSYIETETTTIKNNNSNKVSYSNKFKFNKLKLINNSTVLIYKNIDLPITYISGVIPGGSSIISKEKELDCQIISRTLEKGSKNYTKDDIETILDRTGSQINFACDEESFRFNALSLNENISETTGLLFDILLNPVFPQKEVKTEKEKLLAEIEELKDNTGEIAKRKLSQLIYPKDHPYYSNTFSEDIKNIKLSKLSELSDTHNKITKTNNQIISIVSNLEESKLNNLLKNIESYLTTPTNKKFKENITFNIPDTLIREIAKKETTFVKGKAQSDAFLGHAGNVKRTDPDFYKLHVANFILGGGILANRLSKQIRDNTGLVYHIHSFVNASHGKGDIGIYFGSNNNNVNNAIDLIQKTVSDFVDNGITEQELKKAKESLINLFVSKNLSSYRSIGSTLLGIEFYNLGENYINDYPNIINSLKLNEINDAIRKYLHPDKYNISIAGEYKAKETKN